MNKTINAALGLVIVAAVAIIAGAGIFWWEKSNMQPSYPTQPNPNITTPNQPNLKQPKKPEPRQCTMEAKICPDGSSVGRTGPNCEFAPCPGETPSVQSGLTPAGN